MAIALRKELLDDSAEQLYREFGGIDGEYVSKTTLDQTDKSLYAEEEKQDRWRLLLVEIAHLLSSFFSEARFLEGVRTQKDSFAELARNLGMLSGMPGHDGSLLIRYRGFPTGTGVSADIDYVIAFGNLAVDAVAGAAMLNRMGVRMSHLSGRLTKAFKVFSDHGISTLHLEMPENSESESWQTLRDALNILSRYNHAFKRNSPIVFEKNGKQTFLPLAADEKGQPDINLTLTAGLNGLTPQSVRAMVGKIGTWLKENDSLSYVSVYDAMFGIRSLKGKLVKPPIDANNVKWLTIDRDRMVISREKARVSRVATEHFDSPQQAARMIQTVYGKDYKQIDSENLGGRLKLATEFLDSVGNADGEHDVEKEVLRNIGENLEDVRDEVFEDFVILRDVLKVRSGAKETVIGKIHSRLRSLVSFYKGRSDAHKKMRNLVRKGINFEAHDYQAIAKDFDISPDNAKDLVGLLKSCFDNEGHFLRSVFERHIPEFAKYENKVFRFLWHYLKETPTRNDRVAFVNSLQHLIARMKKPVSAIEMLLSDILREPGVVNFSDRNAFMLATLLVRNYHKELNTDIEKTPEEVLLVKNGLDKEIVNETVGMLETSREKLFEKVKAINTMMNHAIASERIETPMVSVRFLLLLEREMHILLSLAGGNAARAILRSAAQRYGDPASEFYHPRYAELMVQHLTIVIRGIERLGEKQDSKMLARMKAKEAEFLSASENSGYAAKVRRLMNCVDSACERISSGIREDQRFRIAR